MARELAAQDAALAQALRAWAEPVAAGGQDAPAESVLAAPSPISWWQTLTRRCLRDPAAVAVAAGLLTVGGLLMTADVPDQRGGSSGAAEAAIFTEIIPEPLSNPSQEP